MTVAASIGVGSTDAAVRRLASAPTACSWATTTSSPLPESQRRHVVRLGALGKELHRAELA